MMLFKKENEDDYHYEIIICPKCKNKQVAKVLDKKYVSKWHKCNCCEYHTLASEWKEIKTQSQTTIEQAVVTFGIASQIEVCIEECLELALILQQFKRKDKTIEPHAIHTEIADVFIMLDQMQLIFGEENIKNQLFLKKERLQININQQNKQ